MHLGRELTVQDDRRGADRADVVGDRRQPHLHVVVGPGEAARRQLPAHGGDVALPHVREPLPGEHEQLEVEQVDQRDHAQGEIARRPLDGLHGIRHTGAGGTGDPRMVGAHPAPGGSQVQAGVGVREVGGMLPGGGDDAARGGEELEHLQSPQKHSSPSTSSEMWPISPALELLQAFPTPSVLRCTNQVGGEAPR